MGASKSQVTTSTPQGTATRLCTWAGIAGPILFFVIFTVDGAVTPGYSAWAEPVSYLELGPAGWVQVANFIALGILLAAFAFAFLQRMRGRLGGASLASSAILLVVSGLGYVLAGLFVTAPPGRPQYPMHTVAFSTVFFPLGIAAVVAGIRLARVRGWRVFAAYSIVAGLAVVVAALGNLSSLFAPTPQTPLSSPASQQVLGGFGGLANRIVVALALAWYVIVAARLLRETNGGNR